MELTPGREPGEPADIGRIRVTVGIGSFERVHHVEIRETDAEVTVIVFVGIAQEAAQRSTLPGAPAYTMQRLHWTHDFPLSAPLGERTLTDGAPADEQRA